MKQVLVFLGLMTLALQGVAQSGTPDMLFFINFSPISNSPSNSVLRGEADYERLRQLPYLQSDTNSLDVLINLPGPPPQDAWILEKEEDGSLNRIFEVTNLFTYQWYPYQLFLDQVFTLTTNQIHSVIEGNWYAEVDFGDSNYIGNLAPQYDFASGPKVVMDIPPFLGQATISYFAISPNNRTARFVFDGSHCVDPYYLPMQFSWAAWTPVDFNFSWTNPIFTATGMYAAHVFPLGSYIIGLQIDDTLVNGKPYYFPLQVITAGQAVNVIITEIQSGGIPEPKERILLRVLSNAAALFDRGNMIRGCRELEIYQKLVESLHYDSTITHNLTGPAQDIIDVFETEPHHGNSSRRQDASG